MASYVYLFQNGDLYNIGWTNNLEKTKNQYKPSLLIASLSTDQPQKVADDLKLFYTAHRLPASDYFRLSNSQVRECKKKLEGFEDGNYFQPFFTGARLVLFFLLAWVLLTFLIVEFGFEPLFNRFG